MYQSYIANTRTSCRSAHEMRACTVLLGISLPTPIVSPLLSPFFSTTVVPNSMKNKRAAANRHKRMRRKETRRCKSKVPTVVLFAKLPLQGAGRADRTVARVFTVISKANVQSPIL